jgi:hypothetical protein
MVWSLMALVLRRVLAPLVWSNEHAKDLDIVVLRRQLQVLRRPVGRPRFRWSDRLFLAAASHDLALVTWRAFLVPPQTVLRWHRALVHGSVPRDRPPVGPRRGDAQDVSSDGRQLDVRIFQPLVPPSDGARPFLHDRPVVPAEIAEFADRYRRHDAAPQPPVLQQLRDPDAIHRSRGEVVR